MLRASALNNPRLKALVEVPTPSTPLHLVDDFLLIPMSPSKAHPLIPTLTYFFPPGFFDWSRDDDVAIDVYMPAAHVVVTGKVRVWIRRLKPLWKVAFSSLPGLFYSSCDNSGSAPPPQCRGVRYGEVIHAPGAKTLLGFSVCVFLGGRGG